MEPIRCHVCGAHSTIVHAPHCSFRGLPEHRRIVELERERDEVRAEVDHITAQRDRLAEILDTIGSFRATSAQVAGCMNGMARVAVVELMHANGIQWLEQMRTKWKLKEETSDASKGTA